MFGPLFDDSMASPCRKSVPFCGAKHMWKSNAPKTKGFEPLFDDSMAPRCQEQQQPEQLGKQQQQQQQQEQEQR